MPALHSITLESKDKELLSKATEALTACFQDEVIKSSKSELVDSPDKQKIGTLTQSFTVKDTPKHLDEAPVELGTDIIAHLRATFRGHDINFYRPREISAQLDKNGAFLDKIVVEPA